MWQGGRMTEPTAIGIEAQRRRLSTLAETVDPSHGRVRIFTVGTSQGLDRSRRGTGHAFAIADVGPSGAVVGIIGTADFPEVEAWLLERQIPRT
jgi:hypothetical protein